MNVAYSTNVLDIAVAVAQRMKLATLSTASFRATRLHRAETRAENARHATNAAKVLVKLTNHPSLAALAKTHNEAYSEHRRLTLPSVQDGIRVLPMARELEHSDAMWKFYAQHQACVAEFLAAYDDERASAPQRLGSLHDPALWPDRSELEDRFEFTTRYLPCPTDGAWRDWTAETAQLAERELHERLTQALERVVERCGSDGRLYETVFKNLQDLCALAPDFDVAGRYGAIVKAAGEITKVKADMVRDDKVLRAQVAERASEICSMLGGVK